MDNDNKSRRRVINSQGTSLQATLSKTHIDAAHPEKYKPKTHVSVVATNDPVYRPASSLELQEHDRQSGAILKKVDAIYDYLAGGLPEMLHLDYEESRLEASRVHILSLCAASVLAGLIMGIGIISALFKSLPDSLFWLSMGFPAAGVAAANLIILLDNNDGKES